MKVLEFGLLVICFSLRIQLIQTRECAPSQEYDVYGQCFRCMACNQTELWYDYHPPECNICPMMCEDRGRLHEQLPESKRGDCYQAMPVSTTTLPFEDPTMTESPITHNAQPAYRVIRWRWSTTTDTPVQDDHLKDPTQGENEGTWPGLWYLFLTLPLVFICGVAVFCCRRQSRSPTGCLLPYKMKERAVQQQPKYYQMEGDKIRWLERAPKVTITGCRCFGSGQVIETPNAATSFNFNVLPLPLNSLFKLSLQFYDELAPSEIEYTSVPFRDNPFDCHKNIESVLNKPEELLLNSILTKMDNEGLRRFFLKKLNFDETESQNLIQKEEFLKEALNAFLVKNDSKRFYHIIQALFVELKSMNDRRKNPQFDIHQEEIEQFHQCLVYFLIHHEAISSCVCLEIYKAAYHLQECCDLPLNSTTLRRLEPDRCLPDTLARSQPFTETGASSGHTPYQTGETNMSDCVASTDDSQASLLPVTPSDETNPILSDLSPSFSSTNRTDSSELTEMELYPSNGTSNNVSTQPMDRNLPNGETRVDVGMKSYAGFDLEEESTFTELSPLKKLSPVNC